MEDVYVVMDYECIEETDSYYDNDRHNSEKNKDNEITNNNNNVSMKFL